MIPKMHSRRLGCNPSARDNKRHGLDILPHVHRKHPPAFLAHSSNAGGIADKPIVSLQINPNTTMTQRAARSFANWVNDVMIAIAWMTVGATVAILLFLALGLIS